MGFGKAGGSELGDGLDSFYAMYHQEPHMHRTSELTVHLHREAKPREKKQRTGS